MASPHSSRRSPAAALLTLGLALGSANAAAQGRSRLPPTAPTTLPAAPQTVHPQTVQQTAPIAATPTATAGATPRTRAHRAAVSYSSGLLDIRASDSSLNQILREVARLTGMKITGGVADERVFGEYGPAQPSVVLATLLDGTGSNMLLRETATNVPDELYLTPRNGGPTPPNPNAPGFDDGPDDTPAQPAQLVPPENMLPVAQASQQPQSTDAAAQQASGPPPGPPPVNNVNGSSSNTSPTASNFPTTDSVPTDALPTPSTTPAATGIVDAPNPAPAGSTTSTSPNGVKSPQDIYQQLQQLRQAAAQQQSQPSTTTTTPAPQ